MPTQYYLHGVCLESFSSAKYLGVDSIIWNEHPYTRLLSDPSWEYASGIWFPHTQTQIDQVESIQHRAACWIKSDYGHTSSITEMLNSLHLRRLDLS